MTTETTIRSDWADYTKLAPTPVTGELPVSDLKTLTAVELAKCIDQYLSTVPLGEFKVRKELVFRRFQEGLGNRRMTYENFCIAYQFMMDFFYQKKGREFMPKTKCMYRDTINAFERWLVHQGYVQHRFTLMTPRFKPMPKFRQVITYDEWKALLGASKVPMVTYCLKGMWMTGLAMVDLELLEWKHVDLGQMVIRKHRKKSNTPCLVPLVHGSAFHLALLELQREKDKTVGVYPSINGAHYVHNELAAYRLAGAVGMQRYLDTVGRSLGMRRIHWHDFRATFCTVAISVGDPISVSQMTGHTDPKILRDYSQPPLEKLRELMETATRHAEGVK